MHSLFSRVRSFVWGFTLPLRAAALILSKKSLLALSILPLAITLTIYVYFIHRLQEWAKTALSALYVSWGFRPEGWAAWLLQSVTALILIVAGVLTFAFVSSIVASPFNDRLAEHAERYGTPPLPAIRGQTFWRKVRLAWIDLLKTLATGIAVLMTLAVSWVPVVNLVGFVLTLLLMAFQYISYAQTRRGLALGQSIVFLWRYFFGCAGFGLAISMLFAIPFLSCLALPVAVVGGTLLYARAQAPSPWPPLR